MAKPQILLTNDDGIKSPGLWAAAEALSALGFVTVAAPRDQSSGTGRSLPVTSDGVISPETVTVNGKDWMVYAVGGTPAQAVLHGVLEIMPQKPDLVVSGINYGENVATGITVSGTVGAVMEAAAVNIPALAASLETPLDKHLSYDPGINFSAAAFFTAHFARALLEKRFPPDVMLLNLNVPSNATPQTPWVLTRLSRQRYFIPTKPRRDTWDEPGKVGYTGTGTIVNEPKDSDVYTLRVARRVSLTPLSLDFTSRVDFGELEKTLRG